MKNIHLLPTDKPSVLIKNLNRDLEFFKNHLYEACRFEENYNVYVTAEEDIKENDYVITKYGRLVQVSYLLSKALDGATKVVISSDQDLIADGIQAIDDTFLEWFVKNPSCDSVEVEKHMLCDYCGGEHCDNLACRGWEDKPYYEIIIPKEEPKQELLPDFKITKNIFDFVNDLSDTNKEEPKQETLEEAMDKNGYHDEVNDTMWREGVKFGAKWQAERMYTYDELRQIAYNAYCKGQLDEPTEGKFNLWIQQFKKK